MSRIPWRVALRDAALIITGSFVFAVGVDIFEIPHGLAAGGVTGLATVFSAIADSFGFYLPVGLQTIVMNALLMTLVVRSGDKGYIVRTVAGIIACGVLTDALVPFLPASVGESDLPILRPVIGMDKEEIVRIARHIGTFETSILPYEDCCTVFTPRHPKTRPHVEEVREMEQALDVEGLLRRAMDGREVVKLR